MDTVDGMEKKNSGRLLFLNVVHTIRMYEGWSFLQPSCRLFGSFASVGRAADMIFHLIIQTSL